MLSNEFFVHKDALLQHQYLSLQWKKASAVKSAAPTTQVMVDNIMDDPDVYNRINLWLTKGVIDFPKEIN
jgi:hypothetical protein